MTEPLLTALMPLKHYHPAFLEAALRSMLQQTDEHWRLCIIVEAEALDRLTRVLTEKSKDSRVQLVTNQGSNLAGAFNTGMRATQTPFTAILLGDDLWTPDAVAVLNDHIARYPQVDFFHSSNVHIDERGRALSSMYRNPETVSVQDYLSGRSPVKHLLCWRREFGLAIGGMDEASNSIGPDDYDFPWTMLECGARFHAIHQPLYLYRDHRAGYRLTTHVPLAQQRREMERIMRKHGATPQQVRAKLRSAERSYLRQCLYWSNWDEWLHKNLHIRLRWARRERYR